ncbi:bifunctional tetrahydrofolate synthase/dihydrofolate synthase [soil metagenome]
MTTRFASLAAWLEHLEQAHPVGIDMGLARVSRVRDALGIRFECPVFIVGGTNGKGSTCAMLDSMLREGGYRVGLHTSPHLVHFNERARIDGESIGDAALIACFEQVEDARSALTEPVSLSYFEFTLLAILLWFMQSRLDGVVLEVGLGGRLDAVNMIDADCSIVTSVDLDHQAFLGDTREQIGWDKAHIYRAGRPAICADPVPPSTLVAYAESIGADFWRFGHDFNYSGDRQQWAFSARGKRIGGLAYPALRGANQLLNASAALAGLQALHERLPVPAQAIRAGLARVDWPARFQVLPGQPTIVLDVAHNPHAAAALAANLDAMSYHPYTHGVFGCMRDKDIGGIFKAMAPKIDHWHLCNLEGPRAARAEELEPILRANGYVDDGDHSISLHADPAAALRAAREQAGQDDRIVAFGSFSTVGPLLAAPELLRTPLRAL